jgi:hypothetical protein
MRRSLGKTFLLPLSLLALPVWAHENEDQKVLPSDGAAGDQFGWAVAVSDETIVVGAPTHDAGGFTNSGAVYVFVHDGTSWVEEAKLVASDPADNDRFGSSVAVFGDTVFVGAPLADPNGTDSGAVYVFNRSGSTWLEEQKLVGSAAIAGDFFGRSVSVSGGRALVGAPSGTGTSGKVYVYSLSGTWSEEQVLVANDSTPSNVFGQSVCMGATRALVGASGANGNVSGTGAAYVFVHNGTSWVQEQKIRTNDSFTGDLFGLSVSLFNDASLVVGSPGHDDFGSSAGAAYFFKRSGSSWNQVRKEQGTAANDFFGASVSQRYKHTVIGARGDDEEAPNAGTARIWIDFIGATGPTNAMDILVASDAQDDDALGSSVATGECWVVVGARLRDDLGLDSGAAYIYGFDASVTARNGSGVNPLCMTTTALPIIGSNWVIDMDASAFPGAGFTQLLGCVRPLTAPSPTPWGEALVNRSTGIYFTSLVQGSGLNTHVIPIPNSPSVVDTIVYLQGVILDSSMGVIQLCNAEDGRIGCH